jgi:hypothetical protein
MLRAGTLVSVRRGASTSGVRWDGLDPYAGRELLRARAASALMVRRHALSHDSAAHAWGIEFLTPAKPLVHITRDHVRGSRTECGVKHHGAAHDPDQVVLVDGLRVLDPARTAVDIAREHGVHVGVSACDSALRLGVTREELRAASAVMRNWPGVRSARRAIELADPGAENPGESLTRMVVVATGLGPVRTQLPVPYETSTAWCDLAVGAHVVEFDGRVKYRRAEAGGVATAAAEQVVWEERQRERALIRAGLGVSRVVWDDLRPAAIERTRRRLEAEIRETYARGGPELPPELVAFGESMAEQRQRRLRRDGRPRRVG